MSTNFSVRPNEMRDPVVAARRMSELFRALADAMADLPAPRLIEGFSFRTSTPLSASFPIVLPQITTGVKGIVLVKIQRTDGGTVLATGFAWSTKPIGGTTDGAPRAQSQIDAIGNLAVDTEYVMTLQVIDG